MVGLLLLQELLVDTGVYPSMVAEAAEEVVDLPLPTPSLLVETVEAGMTDLVVEEDKAG